MRNGWALSLSLGRVRMSVIRVGPTNPIRRSIAATEAQKKFPMTAPSVRHLDELGEGRQGSCAFWPPPNHSRNASATSMTGAASPSRPAMRATASSSARARCAGSSADTPRSARPGTGPSTADSCIDSPRRRSRSNARRELNRLPGMPSAAPNACLTGNPAHPRLLHRDCLRHDHPRDSAPGRLPGVEVASAPRGGPHGPRVGRNLNGQRPGRSRPLGSGGSGCMVAASTSEAGNVELNAWPGGFVCCHARLEQDPVELTGLAARRRPGSRPWRSR